MFAASVAFVLLMLCLLPIAFLVWRRLVQLVRVIEQERAHAQALIQDGRELIVHLREISSRVTKQMDDVDRMLCTARQWTERADRLVNGVGSIVEPPVFALAQGSHLARVGLKAFLRVLLRGRQRREAAEEQD